MCEGIVSWVTEHQYPITLEILSFYCLFLILPLFLGLRAVRSASRSSSIEEIFLPASVSIPRFLLLLVVLSALYLLYFVPKINGVIDLFHEGEFLIPREQAKYGVQAYTEVYLQHGFGRNYLWYWFSESVFGGGLLGFRYARQVFEPLAYLAVFCLGFSVLRFRLLSSFFLVVLLSGFDYWIGFRQGLGLFALTAFLVALRRESQANLPQARAWMSLAALLSFFAGVFSLEIGLYLLASMITSLLIFCGTTKSKAPLFDLFKVYLLSLGALLLVLFLGMLVAGVVPAVLNNISEQVVCQAKLWGLAYPNPLPLVGELLTLSSFSDFLEFLRKPVTRMWSPLPVLLLSLYWLLRRLRAGEAETYSWRSFLLLYVSAIYFYRTALGRSDYGHWIDGSFLVWVLLLYLFEDCFISALKIYRSKAPQRFSIWLRRCAPTLLVLGTLLFFFVLSFQPFLRLTQRLSALATGENLVSYDMLRKNDEHSFYPKEQYRDILRLKDSVQKLSSESEPIYDFSNQALLHYFLDRPIATRLYQGAYAATIEQQQEVVADLERAKVSIIIWRSSSPLDAFDGIENGRRQAFLNDYIVKNFPEVLEVGRYVLRMR